MAAGKDKAFSRVWLVWQESPAYRKLPARTLRVLTALAQFQEGNCLPTRVTVSYKRLCEMTGLGKPDVSRAVKALADAGFVRKLWIGARGTCYELMCPDCSSMGVGSGNNPIGARDNSEVVGSDSSGVGVRCNCEVGGCYQPIKNPLTSEVNNSNQQGLEASADPEGFTELWRMWPNRNGSRLQASESYVRLIEAGIKPQMLISIAGEFKRGFHADPKYFPQLARWLNPDDIGGWCEPYMDRRARKRREILDGASDDDLREALAKIDARYQDLWQRACENPHELADGGFENQDIAHSYFVRNWSEACDEFVQEPLKAAGFIDIATLPAFVDYCR